MIRTLVVDDERHARDTLAFRLAGEDDFELVGSCASGSEAVAAIERLEPDLVLLDVRMPDLSGFEVLERVGPDRVPWVVFVTAYDEHALRAFDVHAAAYLLKPFDDERFAKALDHVRRLARSGDGGRTREDRREALLELVDELRAGRGARAGDAGTDAPAAPAAERFVVRSGKRRRLVSVDEVDWIEAAGDYVRLHCGGESHLVTRTMRELEEGLDGRFVRIHRSAIVRLDRIRELHTDDHRDFTVVLEGGRRLRLSRTYRERLERALGDRL